MLYQGWIQRKSDEFDLLKSIGILIGSFTNPQAAKEMLRSENAEFKSSDEDFEKTIKMIEDDIEREKTEKHRRRRKLAKENVNG